MMSTVSEELPVETRVRSKWASHAFTAEVCETLYAFRVLKMSGSVFIYVGAAENEALDELATAIPTAGFVGTTIIGPPSGCDSQDLAQLLAKRFRKQVFLSYNVPPNNLIRQSILKRIVEEINANAEAF